MLRVEKVKKEIYQHGIVHLRYDAAGDGKIMIQMVAPKYTFLSTAPSVVFLNGSYVLPISPSWAILLYYFSQELLTARGVNEVMHDTVERAAKVFPRADKATLLKDLEYILKTFDCIAKEKPVEAEIGALTLRQYAKHMSAPHRMDLIVSALEVDGHWNCQNKCLHCYAAGQSLAKSIELPTQHWKSIIDICKKERIPQLTFSGGEPLMREDIVELIEHARWFYTRLNTNGVFLNQKMCDGLYNAGLDSIQVTLYSYDGDVHNELVRAKTFDQTVEGIRHALQSNLVTSINTPLCVPNKDYLGTLKFVHDMGIKYVTCSGLITAGNALQDPSKNTQLTQQELYEILKEAKQYCLKHDMTMTFTYPGILTKEQLSELKLHAPMCGAGISNMAIAPNGDVIPCQSWLKDAELGNILTTDFQKIWQNPLLEGFRNSDEQELDKCRLDTKENV